MPIQTYRLEDFMPGGKVIYCPLCEAEMDTSVRMDGLKILLGLRCASGHEKNFDWAIGTLPPAEALALLEGR